MPQLLLELFSEEIPARMQAQAARDLERLVGEKLKAAELGFEAMQAFAGPRRLTLVIEGLPAAQADRVEERKGPRANAPEQALAGFLRSTGLSREQLVERDGVLFASIARTGRPTPEIVAEIVDQTVRAFPWPKSMTWGRGTLRWVRPLKRIVCRFDGAVVPFAIDGIESGDVTEGHRFMGPGKPFTVKDFADYRQKLDEAFVALDADDRKRRIQTLADEITAARGLEVVPDAGLLDEVAGLAEWPTPVLGDMDPAFLDLPSEVIRTSMRTHQKYFAVRDPKTGALAPHFIAVANIIASDGGVAMTRGYGRVLSARLNDARFFWDEDRKVPLEARLEKLKGVTFHAKLGTLHERVVRIDELVRVLAEQVGADPKLASIAAGLAKADLATGMVGEFPELQGIMGGYYARREPYAGVDPARIEIANDGTEDPLASTEDLELAPDSHRVGAQVWYDRLSRGEVDTIADAVRDHYKPQGPNDAIPTAPVSLTVALADKLDTLVGFFAIGETPTGSRDPYGLRRAALGVIRIILGNGVRLSRPGGLGLAGLIGHHLMCVVTHYKGQDALMVETRKVWRAMIAEANETGSAQAQMPEGWTTRAAEIERELLAFFADRLKVLLRDQGQRHDLVDAVFALGDDDLVRIVARVEALGAFLAAEDGANLLAGYRRAVNILKAEAKKKPDEVVNGAPDPILFRDEAERALAATLDSAVPEIDARLADEDFAGAMRALAALRRPIDIFFENVLVNEPDNAVRLNRLRLLLQMRDAANRIADFSLITQ